MRARGFLVGDGLFFAVAAVLLALLVAALGVVVRTSWLQLQAPAPTVNVNTHASGVAPAATTGRSAPLLIAVSNALATQLTPTGPGPQYHARGDCIVQAGSPDVFVVDEGDTAVGAQAFGPFAVGSTFTVPTLAWALASGPGATVRCQFVNDASVGQGGGGVSSAALDTTYLRLDTANDPLTGVLSSSVAATLAQPTLQGVATGDVCVSTGAGNRGFCISGAAASSADNVFNVTGGSASASGRASIRLGSPVSGVADRYIVRHSSTGGGGAEGVFSVAGTGGLLNESALNGGQLYLADAAGTRTLTGIMTSESTTTGHTFDTTTTLGGANLLAVFNNNGSQRASVEQTGSMVSEAAGACSAPLSFSMGQGNQTGHTRAAGGDVLTCVGGVQVVETDGTTSIYDVDVVVSSHDLRRSGSVGRMESLAPAGNLTQMRALNDGELSTDQPVLVVGFNDIPTTGEDVPFAEFRYNESGTPTAVGRIHGGAGVGAVYSGSAMQLTQLDYGDTEWNIYASTGAAAALPTCNVGLVGTLQSRISNVSGSATSALCWCGCVAGVCSYTALQGTC